MDDDARSAARRRAWIAFGLAGVLLVVNVVAAFAWREERRDRFDDARIEIERRLDERFGEDGPWGRGDRDGSDVGPSGPGPGRMPGGPGGGDPRGEHGDRSRGGPPGPGGPGFGQDGAGPDGTDPDGATQGDADGQGGAA